MCLVPVFTLETDNECLLKFVQMNNASSSIKTATTTYITYNTHVTILALFTIRILQYNYAQLNYSWSNLQCFIITMITIIIIIIIFHLTDAHEKKPHAHVQEAASLLITEK